MYARTDRRTCRKHQPQQFSTISAVSTRKPVTGGRTDQLSILAHRGKGWARKFRPAVICSQFFFIPVSISFSDSELEERARRYDCSAAGKRPAETWRSGVVGRRSIQLGRRRRRPRLNASPSVDARGVARAGTLPTASRHTTFSAEVTSSVRRRRD